MSVPRILISSDQPMCRAGIRSILAAALVGCEFGEADTSSATLELATTQTWDVVIIDLGASGEDGQAVLRAIAERPTPAPPCLVVSFQPEETYAVRALRAGAAGYLRNDAPAERLVHAVQQLLAGRHYVSPQVADQLVSAMLRAADPAAPRHTTLSDREFDVFQRLAGGRTVGEIAGFLKLSVKTVSGYRARVLRKLGLGNNAELMKYALDHGIASGSRQGISPTSMRDND